MVPITVINKVAQDKSLVDALNMELVTVRVRVALGYNTLRSNTYAGYFSGGFEEQLFNDICLLLQPLCPPPHYPLP